MRSAPESQSPAIDADRLQIDGVCDEFERRWLEGQRPRIEELLQGASDPPDDPLRELLLLEIDLRLAAGETPRAEDYRRRFPEHRSIVDDTFRSAMN